MKNRIRIKESYNSFIKQYKWFEDTNHIVPNEFYNSDFKLLTEEEFIEKLLNDDKFNNQWSNGCIRDLVKDIKIKKTGRKKLQDKDKRPKIGITISRKNYNHLNIVITSKFL